VHRDADLPARAPARLRGISRTGGGRDRPFVAAQAVPPWFCSAKMVSARARDLHGARDARCGDDVSSRARFSGDDRRGEEKPFVREARSRCGSRRASGGESSTRGCRRDAPRRQCDVSTDDADVCGAHGGIDASAEPVPARSPAPLARDVSTRKRAVPRGVWREDRRDATLPSRVFRGGGHHPRSFDVPPPSACPSIARRPRTARGPPRHPRFPAPRVFSRCSPATD